MRVDLDQYPENPKEQWDKDWKEIWPRYYWRLHHHYRILEEYLWAPVLDVGGGPAYLAPRVFPNYHHYTCIDISPEAVEIGRKLFPGAYFHVGDAENEPLPFDEGRFRTVICAELLEHIKDHSIIIPELRRVSYENIVITVPLSMEGVGHVYPKWSQENVEEVALRLGTLIELRTFYEAGGFHLAWVRK